MDLLAMLKALVMRPAFDVSRARRIDPGVLGARARRFARLARQHRPAPPRPPARSGLVEVERFTAGRSAGPRTSTRWRPGAGLGFDPPATPCSPVSSRRSPSELAPTVPRRPRSVGLGRRGGAPQPVALVPEGAGGRDAAPRIRARDRDVGKTSDMAFTRCPFRELGRGLPGPRLQPPPRHLEGIVAEVGANSGGLRHVVRPGPMPGHGCGQVT